MLSDNLKATAITLLNKYGDSGALRVEPTTDPITGITSGVPTDTAIMYVAEDRFYQGVEGSMEPGLKRITISSTTKPNNNQLLIDKDLFVYGIQDVQVVSAQNKDIIYQLIVKKSI